MKSILLSAFHTIIFIFFFQFFISCGSDDPVVEGPEVETPVETIVLKKVEIIDGTIYLTWNPVTKTNFDKAKLIILNGHNPRYIGLSKEIIASKIFNDTLSVGKKLEYKITLENEISSSTSNSLFLFTEEISITEELIGFNKLKVTYAKHPIYKNFDYFNYNLGYYKKEGLDKMGGEFIVDRRFVFGGFWAASTYGHEFYPSYNNGGREYAGRSIKGFTIGESFEKKNCKEYVYDKARDVYYGVELIGDTYSNAPREVYIHKLNPDDFSTMTSTYITTVYNEYADITVDPLTANVILDLYFSSYLLNSEDFSVIKHYNGNDYIPNLYYSNMHYRNGKIIIYQLGGRVSIFNATTMELLYTEPTYHYFNISDDGKYFYNNDTIYKIINDEVSFVVSTNIKGSGRYLNGIDFSLSENKCAYTSPDHNPVIYDFNTNTKTVVEEIFDADFVDYDESKKEYLFAQYHVFDDDYDRHSDVSFINLYKSDNFLNRKIEVYDSHNSHFYRYVNGKVIFSGGQYLDESYLSYE